MSCYQHRSLRNETSYDLLAIDQFLLKIPSMASSSKVLQGSGLDDQTENEFYRKFKFELNGLYGKKKLDCVFQRRKDIKYLDPRAEYLIVRAPFKRSEKLLSALAKGIHILHEAFIRKVIKDEKWFDPKPYDIGNTNFDRSSSTELHFPTYATRLKAKSSGGIFHKECVVVLLKSYELKLKYERILGAGGAKVLSRTVQHLADR